MMIIRLFSLILLFGLASCAGQQVSSSLVVKDYHQPGNPGGRLCTAQCKEASNHCADACKYRERICTYDVQAQAIKDYEIYVQEQFKDRLPVDLRPRDFERIDQCIQSACLTICQRNYDSCFQRCGGEITHRSD